MKNPQKTRGRGGKTSSTNPSYFFTFSRIKLRCSIDLLPLNIFINICKVPIIKHPKSLEQPIINPQKPHKKPEVAGARLPRQS